MQQEQQAAAALEDEGVGVRRDCRR
jgi:hypothetical protein